MTLATPRRWYRRDRPPGWLARAMLEPISRLWAGATARRFVNADSTDPGVPVICVGNLTLGGAGKTPVVRELARLLAARGLSVAVLSRGHGGRLVGPVRIEAARHSHRDVGDEPLMMAVDHPVWVARNRLGGAWAAAGSGADVVIMDDGHQNATVRKSLSLVVVDGETRDGEWPFGGGEVFPLGPMRETLDRGLARADAVILLLPADLPRADLDLLALLAPTPVLIARIDPTPPPPGPQVAFAGIGKPWKMERALRAAGCDLAVFISMADHAAPTEASLRRLAVRAEALGAGLLTSEKDWVRLSEAWRPRVAAWPMRVHFEDEQALDRLIDQALRPID
ncbi:MAG TPA: tetraacyldisaccharide 4'-kinase [Caulobacteraceae bacterium]|nr:tetraacyldisaccharide 4'-kinase [Caulobacteraceae bacterium]